MTADMNAYLPLIIIGLIVLAVAVWVFTRVNRKAKLRDDGSAPAIARDVLDEGAARAQRNQALIDAAPAAAGAEAAVTATPAPLVEPAPAPAPASAPAPATTADDLSRIKGLGPKLGVLLGELGVTSFAQIASWSDDDVTRIDAQLGRFQGRITRDQWVEQAKLLCAHDEAAFAEKFGRNG